MRSDLNKLIRDKIPALIEKEGREFEVAIMEEAEYRRALLDKLVEEANEAAQAPPDELIHELADLCEVLDAILTAFTIERKILQEEQLKRRHERGGFKERLRLLWISK